MSYLDSFLLLICSYRFNDCSPSLSITICHDISDKSRSRLEEVQRQSRNSFGLIVSNIDDYAWMDFQNSMEIGTMRLMKTKDIHSAATLILQIRETMNCPERYDNQNKYFQSLSEHIIQKDKAEEICHNLLSTLDIPVDEMDIIVEAFPSLSSLFLATSTELEENLPVSEETIQKLSLLFETITPTLS
jgi:hypothetical protein